MTKDEIKKRISEIVDSYIMDIWITPHFCRKYIPSENIPKLKESLSELLEGGSKNGKKS